MKEYQLENISKKEIDTIDLKDRLYSLGMQIRVLELSMRDPHRAICVDTQVKELQKELENTLLVVKCWEHDN